MKTLENLNLPNALLTIVIITLCLIILQAMHTRAQTTYQSGEIEKWMVSTPEAIIELTRPGHPIVPLSREN